MPHKLITQQKQFLEICNLINDQGMVALDTEFMRDKTYYAVLCLLQINVAGQCFIIDVLSKEINLDPIFTILADNKITKIFHSVKQDIAVLNQILPNLALRSIVDTQVMANFCGTRFDIGYANLVKILFDKILDKNFQRSDWELRPLSQGQIDYALIDVFYLPLIYDLLKTRLVAENKMDWFIEEMQLIINKTYDEDLFKKFSLANKTQNYQENVRLLVLWRNQIAQKNNVPRSFVIPDQLLDKIAYYHPKNYLDLEKCGFTTKLFNKKIDQEIIELLKNNHFEWQKEVSLKKIDFKLNKTQNDLLLLSKSLLHENSRKYNLAPELIINQSDLKKIILKLKTVEEVLGTWRFEVFGKDLKQLINQ